MQEKTKKNSKMTVWFLIFSGLFVVAMIILFFTNGRETRISSGQNDDSIMALRCVVEHGLEDAFFASSSANTIENELKLTFKNSKLDKLFYSYTGVYRSNEMAVADEAVLHAKYNIYMGSHDQQQDSLVPAYSIVKSKLIITLYADDYSKINAVTSDFFFLDSDKLGEYEGYSIEEMEKYYEAKDFSCTISV